MTADTIPDKVTPTKTEFNFSIPYPNESVLSGRVNVPELTESEVSSVSQINTGKTTPGV